MNGTRGIPKGQAPRRLTDNQRNIIVSLLKAVPNCMFVMRQYQALVGPVSHMAVYHIQKRLIAEGALEPVQLQKSDPEACRAAQRAYYHRNRGTIQERRRARRAAQ